MATHLFVKTRDNLSQAGLAHLMRWNTQPFKLFHQYEQLWRIYHLEGEKQELTCLGTIFEHRTSGAMTQQIPYTELGATQLLVFVQYVTTVLLCSERKCCLGMDFFPAASTVAVNRMFSLS